MNQPIVQVVGINKCLVDCEPVLGEMRMPCVSRFGIKANLVARRVIVIELFKKPLVGPGFAIGVSGFDQAEDRFRLVTGEGGDDGEDVAADGRS